MIETLIDLYSSEDFSIYNENTDMSNYTHRDIIENWREYLNYAMSSDSEHYKSIEAEIDDAENWHVENNSIDDEVYL